MYNHVKQVGKRDKQKWSKTYNYMVWSTAPPDFIITEYDDHLQKNTDANYSSYSYCILFLQTVVPLLQFLRDEARIMG